MAVDTARPVFPELSKAAVLPSLEQCTHKTGRLWLTVSNWGILGNQRNVFFRDCLTGGFSSSAEFPGGSGLEYLFQGALWIGGIIAKDRDVDTLVSVGNDGWVNIWELFPAVGSGGGIIKRSARPTSPYYSPGAVSDLDLISVFYDTLKDPRLVTSPDPESGELFRPLGLKIEQRSYSWAADFAKDWVLLDYTITNIGPDPIRQAYFGILLDPDIGSVNANRSTHTDDYCAFKPGAFLKIADPATNFPGLAPSYLICRETLNLAYAYDNDGDPEDNGEYGVRSPTGVIGLRILRAGEMLQIDGTFRNTNLAFNWWVPDSNGILDWGPQHLPGRENAFGHYGQPIGDKMRYYYLSNQELDYDQILSATNQNPPIREIWRPPLFPPEAAIGLANGADSRFLLSVGPFNLEVGESIPFTFALLAGEKFHTDPANFASHFQYPQADFLDAARIQAYQNRLSLGALIANARMAKNVFDNENIRSTVICQIDSHNPTYDIRLIGDGIPDFKGPAPPPFPKVEFSTAEGEAATPEFLSRGGYFPGVES